MLAHTGVIAPNDGNSLLLFQVFHVFSNVAIIHRLSSLSVNSYHSGDKVEHLEHYLKEPMPAFRLDSSCGSDPPGASSVRTNPL